MRQLLLQTMAKTAKQAAEKITEKRKPKIYSASGKLDRSKRTAKTADVSEANMIKPRLREHSKVNYAETSIARAEQSRVKRKRTVSPTEEETPAKRAKRMATEKLKPKEETTSPKKKSTKKETNQMKQHAVEQVAEETSKEATLKKEKSPANIFSDAVRFALLLIAR